MFKLKMHNDSLLNSTKHYHESLVVKVQFICSLLVSNSFRLFKAYVKTIKKHFEQGLLPLKTASMNIKVKKQSSVI